MKKLLSVVAIAFGALGASTAHAVPVTQWKYDVNAAWSGQTFNGSSGCFTTTGTEISWGADVNGGTAGCGAVSVGMTPTTLARSGIFILNTPQTGTIFTNSLSPQPTNSYAHINNPLAGTFSTLLTATVTTTLTLTPLAPPAPGLDPDTIVFNINFAETPNVTPISNCGFPSTSSCDDIFVVTFGALNNEFIYDGFKYFVSIVKTAGPIDPLPDLTCQTAGAPAGCLGFQTTEGARTQVDFGIVITSRPLEVPEPAALSLVGLGLLGIAAARRRAKTA
jgi:hypothetical protein